MDLRRVRRALRPARPACSATLGVAPGDVVAWLCGNTHELLEAYYGVLLAGGVLLPLNIRLAPPELRVHPRRQPARRAVPPPRPARPRARRPHGHCSATSYEALLAAQPAGPVGRPRVDERGAGRALLHERHRPASRRARCSRHRGLYLHAIHTALTNGLSGDDVILHTIPLFHVNGWGTPHYVTGLGGVHVMLPRFDAGRGAAARRGRSG